MSIHRTDELDHFLRCLSLREPRITDDFEILEAAPSQLLSDLEHEGWSASINIWHCKSSSISVSSVMKIVIKELQKRDHLATPEIAKLLLAASCLTVDRKTSSVNQLENVLTRIGKADSSQFWIAPYHAFPNLKNYQLGRFTIGKLDRQKLMHRCRKVNCDFFERYPKQFQNRFAVESSPETIRVFDWDGFKLQTKPQFQSIWVTLRDRYFDHFTERMNEKFCREFESQQEIFVVAGAPFVELNSISASLGGHFVSIYQNIGDSKRGYFCPLGMSACINYNLLDQKWLSTIKELKDDYAFTDSDAIHVPQTLKSYCRFVCKAKNHANEGSLDEAFLHYVIAIDLLFGEKDSSTQKISQRTAIVVSEALEEPFVDMTKKMKKIYDKRSKYVHAGISISDRDIEQLEPIIQEVFLCLLRLRMNPSSREEGFFDSWLKKLDYFIAATESEKPFSDEEREEAGISCHRLIKSNFHEFGS